MITAVNGGEIEEGELSSMKGPSSERDGMVKAIHEGRRGSSRGNTELLSFAMHVAVMWIVAICWLSYNLLFHICQ
jgi:hypothetical protein